MANLIKFFSKNLNCIPNYDIQNILPCYSNIINSDSHLDKSIPDIIKSIKNNIFKDYEKEHGIKNIELNIILNKKEF